MNTKCPKCKDGHQTIIYGDVSQRLKCKCEIPNYGSWRVGEIPRYDNDSIKHNDSINKESEIVR